MAQRGQVHADLVRAAGVEITAQESMAATPAGHLVASPGEAAAADDGHPFALLWVSSDRPLELSSVIPNAPAHDRHVRAAERAVLQLRCQCPVAPVVARDHDEARRALVEPVDDAG